MPNFKAMIWRIMYIGAVLCAFISLAVVYQITVSGDTSNEWIIWTCVIIGFCLFGFGFVYESRNKEPSAESEELSKIVEK